MAFLELPQYIVYPDSIVSRDGATYAMARSTETGQKRLLVQGDTGGFEGEVRDGLLVCLQTAQNAAELRARLDWLNPAPLGRQTSFGFGDRLGSATPGHVASLRAADPNGRIGPIFAQQSVRENTRTRRTPQEVVDGAMWGVFQEGWRDPWGADADHIKETADLEPFIKAGYTFYTIDPSDHVDNEAQTDDEATLRLKAKRLPWQRLGTSYDSLRAQYCAESLSFDGLSLVYAEQTFLRALAKYGRAILHTAEVAAFLDEAMTGREYDLEMSVDETDTPTSIHEHYFIANELHVRGIPVVSLAPRFVGKFQKGVDYIGDTDEFAVELAKHMAILHHFDEYKISIHTGSDKFSIYGIINDQARGHAHVKTAGTSYLEALRVVASSNPPLFRAMLDLAHQNFEKDRKTYFVDCQPHKVPTGEQLEDGQLPELLDHFDSRQLLHVTFGSILDAYGDELEALLMSHEAAYRAGLEVHFASHLRPFC
jgi:hypothetical protein